MSVRQKAIGVAWALPAADYTYGAAAAVGAGTALKVKTTGMSYRKLADSVETKDNQGEVNGKVYFNQREELTLRVYPSDTTLALGKAAGASIGPAIGDKFYVDDPANPDLETDMKGAWLVEGLSKERVQDGIVTFEVQLMRYAADITADTA
jgi:hypothetical protein